MHKYAKESSFSDKLVLSLKVHGPVKTFRFALIKILLPLYKFAFSGQEFEYENKKIKYFLHSYNNTWDNERGVEVAIFKDLFEERKDNNVLEIGHVLGHYIPNNGRWEVLDKFEKAAGVINEDIIDFKPGKKYDYIFSISTMEHVGYDDDEVNKDLADKAIDNIKYLLNENGVFVMSDPLGYNKEFDQKIVDNRYGFKKIIFMKRIGYRNWKEVTKNDIKNTEYDKPYNAANALAICYFYKNS